MTKTYMVVSINYTTKKVAMAEKIGPLKAKESGNQVEFLSKVLKWKDLDELDHVGRILTLTESFA